jgi:hypothetical protein
MDFKELLSGKGRSKVRVMLSCFETRACAPNFLYALKSLLTYLTLTNRISAACICVMALCFTLARVSALSNSLVLIVIVLSIYYLLGNKCLTARRGHF